MTQDAEVLKSSVASAGRHFCGAQRADRAIARSTGDPRRESSAYEIAAEAALMLGDEERARELARDAIAALPDNPYAHATWPRSKRSRSGRTSRRSNWRPC
jgi:hypothetical protein